MEVALAVSACHLHGSGSALPSEPHLPLSNRKPCLGPLCTQKNTAYNNTAHPLLYHLVLVTINAHFAVADNKGIDVGDVAHRTRSQYAIQPSRECVCILLKHLQPRVRAGCGGEWGGLGHGTTAATENKRATRTSRAR